MGTLLTENAKSASKADIVAFERHERPAKFWQAMGPNFASEEIRRCLPTLHDEPQNDVWFLVLEKGRAISFSCLRFASDGKTALLAHHWASDGCRGRGYARLMMEARIDYAKSAGVRRLRSVVHADSLEAFKEAGFSVTAPRAQFSNVELEL